MATTLPTDVRELVHDALRHRVVLSYDALADDVTTNQIIDQVLVALDPPDVVHRPG